MLVVTVTTSFHLDGLKLLLERALLHDGSVLGRLTGLDSVGSRLAYPIVVTAAALGHTLCKIASLVA